MTPAVSVVIPTFRHAATIVATLESVFAQTFGDHEVIVVNDGSPDDTAAVLAPFVADGRIVYVAQPNAGQGAARNRGIAIARGDFVALLDDDDLWPADKLAWQVDALRRAPTATLVYGYAELFGDRAGRVPATPGPAGDVHRAFCERNYITSPGQTLIRADALRCVGGFDPAIWGCDDWDLCIRLAAIGPFVYEDRVALRYRLHGDNASRQTARMVENGRKVLRKNVGRFPRPGWARTWYRGRRFVVGARVTQSLDSLRGAREQGRWWAEMSHACQVLWHWPPYVAERLLHRLVFSRSKH